jgi:nucleoside-diphosphate-sugar epimerase
VAGVIAARSEADFLHANARGTSNVISAMAATGGSARLVLVSSMAAGGPAPRGRPLDGTGAPGPVTQYGRSKLAGEAAVRRSALRWTILRPPMVYGPRDTEVLKVFKLAGGPLAPVFGDGRQELSGVYGPDLADALIAAAASDRSVGRTYYPCHPEIFSSEQFVQAVGRAVKPDRGRDLPILHLPLALARGALTITGTIAALAGKATVLTADKANEFFQAAWTGDPAPLTRDTGWQAATSLATGLPLTAAWYREAGWL